MSRIRTIKPEFWTSEQVVSCSPNARLLFIGLWNFCDDNGVHPASYIRIKAEVFPADIFSTSEIKDWINELISSDLIRKYMVDDKVYWIVTGWKAHQRIDRPTYRHPLPQSDLKKIEDNSMTIPRVIDDYSKIIHQSLDESSTTEWKGMEGKGMDKDTCEVETSPVCSSDSILLANTQDIFHHWQEVMNHPKAKLDNKRKKTIQKALKDYGVEEIKLAINGCANTPYNMGENDKSQRYDDIGLILRDADHIERFINNADIKKEAKSANNSEDLMAGVL